MIVNRIGSYFDMAVVVALFIFWTSRDVSTLFVYCSITSSLCRFMSFSHDPVLFGSLIIDNFSLVVEILTHFRFVNSCQPSSI